MSALANSSHSASNRRATASGQERTVYSKHWYFRVYRNFVHALFESRRVHSLIVAPNGRADEKFHARHACNAVASVLLRVECTFSNTPPMTDSSTTASLLLPPVAAYSRVTAHADNVKAVENTRITLETARFIFSPRSSAKLITPTNRMSALGHKQPLAKARIVAFERLLSGVKRTLVTEWRVIVMHSTPATQRPDFGVS